jgi:hypothetical protein
MFQATPKGRPCLSQQGQSRTLPLPISAPGSALGLLPSIALSSAQAMSSLREGRPKHQIAGLPNRAFEVPLLGGFAPRPPGFVAFVAKMALKQPLWKQREQERPGFQMEKPT